MEQIEGPHGTGLGEGCTSRDKTECKDQKGTEECSLGLEVHSSRHEEEQRDGRGKDIVWPLPPCPSCSLPIARNLMLSATHLPVFVHLGEP